jgi:hypothetical protein
MVKNIFVIICVLCAVNGSSQLPFCGTADNRLPSTNSNKAFVDTISCFFNQLIQKKTDSVLLFFETDLEPNYALAIWKKGTSTKCVAFIQIWPRLNSPIKTIEVENIIIKNLDIYKAYNQFAIGQTELIDTNNILGRGPILGYGLFYMAGNPEIQAAYIEKIGYGLGMGKEFSRQYKIEKSKIIQAEAN